MRTQPRFDPSWAGQRKREKARSGAAFHSTRGLCTGAAGVGERGEAATPPRGGRAPFQPSAGPAGSRPTASRRRPHSAPCDASAPAQPHPPQGCSILLFVPCLDPLPVPTPPRTTASGWRGLPSRQTRHVPSSLAEASQCPSSLICSARTAAPPHCRNGPGASGFHLPILQSTSTDGSTWTAQKHVNSLAANNVVRCLLGARHNR